MRRLINKTLKSYLLLLSILFLSAGALPANAEVGAIIEGEAELVILEELEFLEDLGIIGLNPGENPGDLHEICDVVPEFQTAGFKRWLRRCGRRPRYEACHLFYYTRCTFNRSNRGDCSYLAHRKCKHLLPS